MDPSTKDRHWWIGNKYGFWSKVLLISIPYADAVQARVKGPAPSFIYVDELTNCPSREYFTYTHAQLNRRREITGKQHWTASCNPEGPSHWVYELFWDGCKRDSDACRLLEAEGVRMDYRIDIGDTMEPGIERDSRFRVYHVPYTDNESRLPANYVNSLKTNLASDPIEYARLIEGKWIDRPSGAAIFKTHFREETHLLGDAKKKTGLAPSSSFPIVVGYDLGSVNSCISFMQQIPTENGEIWIVFDEIPLVAQKVSYNRLVRAILLKMAYWCEYSVHKYSFWHISDNSAFNQYRAQTGSFDVLDVERISKEIINSEWDKFKNLTPIRMTECPKPPGSIEQRVRILMDMLNRDELFVSAACAFTRDMFLQLESEKMEGRGKFNPSLPFTPRKDKRGHIHQFDALTYPIYYYKLTGRRLPEKTANSAVTYHAA